jgi:hypothetical protein
MIAGLIAWRIKPIGLSKQALGAIAIYSSFEDALRGYKKYLLLWSWVIHKF